MHCSQIISQQNRRMLTDYEQVAHLRLLDFHSVLEPMPSTKLSFTGRPGRSRRSSSGRDQSDGAGQTAAVQDSATVLSCRTIAGVHHRPCASLEELTTVAGACCRSTGTYAFHQAIMQGLRRGRDPLPWTLQFH